MLEFFRHLPTTWDDTRVLHGAIGQHITMARRKGEEWFVGTLNARERRTLDVPLRFLVPGRKYTASIYGDAQPEGSAPRRVAIEERAVDAQTVIRADLAENGGQAIRIRPASPWNPDLSKSQDLARNPSQTPIPFPAHPFVAMKFATKVRKLSKLQASGLTCSGALDGTGLKPRC